MQRVLALTTVATAWLWLLSPAAADPCADFAASRNGRNTGLDASLFKQCIQAVPFSASKASATLTNLKKFLSIVPQAPYFLDPANSALEVQAFNLNDTLEGIQKKVDGNEYTRNWDFDFDVVETFHKFRDGHTYYEPTCMYGFFYVHNLPLVSVSDAPDAPPKMYWLEHDFEAKTWTPPVLRDEVVEINGKDAHDFVSEFVRTTPEFIAYLDPDAAFNYALYGFPEGTNRGRFNRRNMWDGEELKMKFANGTEVAAAWTVALTASMVKDGALLFKDTQSLQDLCYGGSSTGSSVSGDEAAASTINDTPPLGFPVAVAHSPEYAMSTYTVANDTETILLNIRTFGSGSMNEDEFVAAQQKFMKEQLAAWKSGGIKRLIIDVSSNSGGKAILPYDFVRQLFPDDNSFPLIDMLYSPTTWAYMKSLNSGKQYDYYEDEKGGDFKDLADWLGPVEKEGTYFTKKWRQDYVQLADEVNDITISSGGEQLFKAEDIIIVSNSLCASACHTLVEALNSKGVRGFAYGGRPTNGSMQVSGGTKGGKVLAYEEVRGFLNDANETASILKTIDGDPDTWMLEELPVSYTNLMVNSENKYREDGELPLILVYTPTCQRFSLTKEMLGNVAKVWEAVKDLAWTDEGAATECVDYEPATEEDSGGDNGSSGGNTSKSGSDEDASDDDEEASGGRGARGEIPGILIALFLVCNVLLMH